MNIFLTECLMERIQTLCMFKRNRNGEWALDRIGGVSYSSERFSSKLKDLKLGTYVEIKCLNSH